jgi:hypothetical protein
MKNLLSCKQKEGEQLQEYTKRIKTARDVLEQHIGGPIELTRYIKTLEEWDANDETKMKKCYDEACKQFLAFNYLNNCDKSKYGTLLDGFHTQESLGNTQYPTTLTEANNVLSNHRCDNTPTRPNDKGKRDKDDNKDKETQESKEESPELSFSQMEGKCCCFGKGGHMRNNCRHKNKPKSEWVVNKSKQEDSHMQEQPTEPPRNETSTPTPANASTGWAGVHENVQFYQYGGMKDVILLDNQ